LILSTARTHTGRQFWWGSARLYLGILALVSLLVAILFWDCLDYYFVTDDFALIEAARAPLSVGVPYHFTPRPGEQYRPLAQYGYFWLVQDRFGLSSFSWHLANMVLHVLVVAVALMVFRQLLDYWLSTLTAAVYFGIHSSLFLVFAWVAIAGEIWITFFALLTLALYLRYLRASNIWLLVCAAVACVLALLSKEMAISVPVIAVFAQLIFAPNASRIGRFPVLLRPSSIPFVGIWLVYLLLVRRPQGIPESGPYAPQMDPGAVWTFLTYAWWTVDIARIRDFPPNAFLALVGIGLAAVAIWSILRRERVVIFGLGWFAIGIGPVLFFPDHMFHYYLYWPLSGMAIILGVGIERWLQLPYARRRLYAGAGLVLLALVVGNYRGIQLQHDHDMTMMQAEQGKRVLNVVQAENPELADGTTLYFVEPASHVFHLMGYGAAPRLYYPETHLNVYFEGHIPPPEEMSEPVIAYRWDGHTVVNVTEEVVGEQ
jgi:hypothetical protein